MHPGSNRCSLLIALVAMAGLGGLFFVPLQAFLSERKLAEARAVTGRDVMVTILADGR